MNSGWELYVAAKLWTNFKHLKIVSTFLLILEKKTASYKILKEIRAAIASVVGLIHPEFKFTDYHIALQNLAYLQTQDSLVKHHHIYRSMYWKAALKDLIFW